MVLSISCLLTNEWTRGVVVVVRANDHNNNSSVCLHPTTVIRWGQPKYKVEGRRNCGARALFIYPAESWFFKNLYTACWNFFTTCKDFTPIFCRVDKKGSAPFWVVFLLYVKLAIFDPLSPPLRRHSLWTAPCVLYSFCNNQFRNYNDEEFKQIVKI